MPFADPEKKRLWRKEYAKRNADATTAYRKAHRERLLAWTRANRLAKMQNAEFRQKRALATRTHGAKYPERVRARKALGKAIKAGKITRPTICSICETPCRPHGHHDDYSKPLDVRWVCQRCHVEIHRPGIQAST